MGAVHTRNAELMSRGSQGGSVGGAPSGVAPLGGGAPTPEAGQANPMAGEGGQDDRLSVVFTWNQGGQRVFLAASFNGWRDQIPMVRSGNEFSVVHDLPRGVHQYKFIVDDQWRFATDQPKTQDSAGNVNNVLDISTYTRFQAGLETEPMPRYGQVIPELHDYTLDAPVIPLVLLKSPFCAVPPRPESTGNPQLSIQTHAFCDHIYVKDRDNESVPTTIAVTHRYGQKYSTTVFATRGPGFDPSAAGRNVLKTAVRRAPRPS